MLINDLVELGELIRKRRTELDLSQTELAEKVGATRQWVSRLEKGKNDVTALRLLAVIDALELNLDVRAPLRGPVTDYPTSLVPRSTLDAITKPASMYQVSGVGAHVVKSMLPDMPSFSAQARLADSLSPLQKRLVEVVGLNNLGPTILEMIGTSKTDTIQKALKDAAAPAAERKQIAPKPEDVDG